MSNIGICQSKVHAHIDIHTGTELKKPPKTLILPRIHVQVYLLTIPPIPEAQLEGHLAYRLRGLYPGNIENAEYDYIRFHRNNDDEDSVILFAAPGSELSSIAGPSVNMVLPVLYIVPWLEKKQVASCFFVVETPEWIEIIQFQNACLVFSRVYDLSNNKSAIYEELSENKENTPVYFLSLCGNREIDSKILSTLNKAPIYVSGKDIFSQKPLKKALFSKKRGIGGQRSLLRSVLIICIAILSLGSWVKTMDVRESYRTVLLRELTRRRAQLVRERELVTEYQELRNRAAALADLPVYSPYQALSVIQELGGRGFELRNFVFRENGFEIQGRGRETLSFLRRLSEHPDISTVELLQILSVGDEGLEQFSIAGRLYD
ncbi:MAG: hypothetical protein ACLFR1_11165 [Spirochaetia bacterium]